MATLSNLFLPSPECLPTFTELDQETKLRLQQALVLQWTALQKASSSEALNLAFEAYKLLQHSEASVMANVHSSLTSLKSWEIVDYDSFFGVQRIQSLVPIESVVLSFTIAYLNFLDISQHTSASNSILINQQIDGFRTYVKLLSRVLKIDMEEFHE